MISPVVEAIGPVLHQVHTIFDNRPAWGRPESDLELPTIVEWAKRQRFKTVVVCSHTSDPAKPCMLHADSDTIALLHRIQREVQSLNSVLNLIFAPEVNIMGDGTVDVPFGVLRDFQYVVAGRHATPGYPDDATGILRALTGPMRNQFVRAIVHFDRYARDKDVDWAELFRVADLTGTAVEFNYSICPGPEDQHNLDIVRRIMDLAFKSGATILVGTDTHQNMPGNPNSMFAPHLPDEEVFPGVGVHCLAQLEVFHRLLTESGLASIALTNNPDAFAAWVARRKSDLGRNV